MKRIMVSGLDCSGNGMPAPRQPTASTKQPQCLQASFELNKAGFEEPRVALGSHEGRCCTRHQCPPDVRQFIPVFNDRHPCISPSPGHRLDGLGGDQSIGYRPELPLKIDRVLKPVSRSHFREIDQRDRSLLQSCTGQGVCKMQIPMYPMIRIPAPPPFNKAIYSAGKYFQKAKPV